MTSSLNASNDSLTGIVSSVLGSDGEMASSSDGDESKIDKARM